MTKIFDFKKEIPSTQLKLVSQALKEGKLVIFPTETVYGIGANALDPEAVDSIFIAKGRANDNPLIVHVANFDMIKLQEKSSKKQVFLLPHLARIYQVSQVVLK